MPGKGGRRSTTWTKGHGGPGRPRNELRPEEERKMVADVKAAAKALTPEAFTTLVEVMQSAKAPAGARISAATAILDRGWGKPAQAPTGAAGGDVVIHVSGPLVNGYSEDAESD
jgi:hypothetical protein